jgi:hypothetical protein
MKKDLRELREAALNLGFDDVEVVYAKGKGHPRLRVTHAGRQLLYVVPFTASDWRGRANMCSDLRRFLRGGSI